MVRQIESREPATLSKFLSETEFSTFIEYLLTSLGKFPQRYAMYFLCPQLSGKGQGGARYNSDISTFESINHDVSLKVPVESAFGTLNAHVLKECGIPPGFYFRINSHGIAGRDIGFSAIDTAMRRFKVLLAILIASKRVTVSHGFKWFGPVKGHLLFVDETKKTIQEVNLPHAFRVLLGKIVLAEEQPEGIALGELAGLVAKVSRIKQFDLSSKGCQVILNFNQKTDLTYLHVAAEWIIDALATDHSLPTRILLISAAIESILSEGEKIDTSLTEKLTDRCAYALSMTLNQRREVRKQFKAFYRLRSQLTHGSSVLLDQENKSILRWGEWAALTLFDQEIRRYGLGIA